MINDTSANQTTTGGMEESLSSYFQRSAAIVRQYADLIEQDYAQPLLSYASIKFREKPVTMIFLSVFSVLSVLPLLSFVGLTVFILSSIIFLAFIFAAIAFITVEATLMVCLAFMLWSLFIVACFITAVVVFVYWTTRLGVLFTHEGPSGVRDWAHETKRHLVFYAKKREATEESDESAVLVDQDGPSSKKIKVEEEATPNN